MYGELSGEAVDNLTPKDIYDIAEGILTGNREAAVRSFDELGEMAGAAIVSALSYCRWYGGYRRRSCWCS